MSIALFNKSQSKLSLERSPLLCLWQISTGLTIACGLLSGPALAQSIHIDGSTPTLLNGLDNCSGNCIITGGARDGGGSGPSLFHSFRSFNIDTGSTVTFTDPGVANIFSRITEVSPLNASTIDGTLKVDGPANLFLLNPNGIIFGRNAQLDLQGSFLSTTADSLLFEDNAQFSVGAPLPSLLNIHVPAGLQFGSAPAPIQIQGDGHGLAYNPDSTITRNLPSTDLTATNGQTLAFLGGDVLLQGGNLTSEAGHLEIAGLGDDAQVLLNPTSSGWDFDYSAANSFRDIRLLEQSSLDVSGLDAGSIQLQGRQINFSEGSAAIAQISGSGGGQIALNASERVQLTGVDLSPVEQMPTSVYIEIAPGATGDGSSRLTVTTPQLALTAGAQIGLSMAGAGTAGSVDVTAQSVTADNGSNATPSSLFAAVLPVFGPPPGAIGQGGDLNITTDQLSVTNGAQLIASTFGAGNAGNLNIEAKNIEVRGFNAGGPSILISASEVPMIPPLPNGSGNGGEITIRTERLLVAEGGQISVGTNGANPAGNININASQAIELRGATEQGRSGLFASSRIGPGAGGNIQVNTPQLSLLEGATINVSNFSSTVFGPPPGTGPAGDVNIVAREIVLKDGSLITADTVSGDRANITLQADSLVLRRSSSITTNATGTATGGNINIDTQALIAFENSDITANATDNFGGRVIVEAQTILGTAFRDQLTAESDITATSALGPAFSGTVEINTPKIDPAAGLAELPQRMVAADQIVAACEQINSNAFIATGRGGLPEDASSLITGQSIWNDFRLMESGENAPVTKNTEPEFNRVSAEVPTSAIVEAQTWSLNESGQVTLGIHTEAPVTSQSAASCLSS
jgi:filamentous hemagglutinin family protein